MLYRAVFERSTCYINDATSSEILQVRTTKFMLRSSPKPKNLQDIRLGQIGRIYL